MLVFSKYLLFDQHGLDSGVAIKQALPVRIKARACMYKQYAKCQTGVPTLILEQHEGVPKSIWENTGGGCRFTREISMIALFKHEWDFSRYSSGVNLAQEKMISPMYKGIILEKQKILQCSRR